MKEVSLSDYSSDCSFKRIVHVKENVTHINLSSNFFSQYESPIIFIDWRKALNHNQERIITIDSCKFISSSFGQPKSLETSKILKWVNAPIIILGPLDRKVVQKCCVTIRNCTFSEIGFLDKKIPLSSACIYVDSFEKVTIEGCTIDGCVGSIQSFGICISSVEVAIIKDVFFTDIFSHKDSRAIFYNDCNLSVEQCPQTSILNNISVEEIEKNLSSHPSYKEEAKCPLTSLEVVHLKNIVPHHEENFHHLLNEHKWREFRTLDRLVCHQADKRSETTALYGKWVEHLCYHLFQVEAKVVVAFANLYPNGEITLPFHRDQYHKWVIGLSFGETRTFTFLPDDPNEKEKSFLVESGDVVIFSPDVNNHYQHGIPAEKNRTKERINLTFFVDVKSGNVKENFLTEKDDKQKKIFSEIVFPFHDDKKEK